MLILMSIQMQREMYIPSLQQEFMEQEIKKELLALCNQVQNLIQLSNLVPLLEL
jgi:hypothetical protein